MNEAPEKEALTPQEKRRITFAARTQTKNDALRAAVREEGADLDAIVAQFGNVQTIAGILSNPFYCGIMEIKGKQYPHHYPRLVEPSVFRACQMRKRNFGMPQQAVKVTRHPFLLRGLVTCAVSGRKATCSLQKGRYVYLMARDPSNPEKIVWVKEEAVLEQLREVLHSFNMGDELLDKALDYIKRTHEAEKELHHASVKQLQIESNNLTGKLDRLTDLLVEGHIQEEVYDRKRREIDFRQTEINCILKDNHDANDRFKDALCKIIALVSKSYDLFESSNTDQRRNLLGFVFSNLSLEGATLRYTLRKPFEIFAQLPNNPEWRAGRDETANWKNDSKCR